MMERFKTLFSSLVFAYFLFFSLILDIRFLNLKEEKPCHGEFTGAIS